MKLTKTLMTMAAALVTATGISQAGTFTSQANGNWATPATWGLAGTPVAGSTYPGTGDVVNANHDITVSGSEACAQFTLAAGNVMLVSGTLTLDAANNASTINGTLEVSGGTFVVGATAHVTVVGSNGAYIVMDGNDPRITVAGTDGIILDNTGSAGVYALIIVDATPGVAPDAVIDGSGSIRGDTVNDTVEINFGQANPVQLKLDTAMLHGSMTIQRSTGGNALFDNQGIVRADAGGAIVLDSSLNTISDTAGSCASPRWQAASSSVLTFNKSATGLTSQFGVAGTLNINAAVWTNNSLNFVSGGTINAGVSNDFRFSGVCSGSCNPGTPLQATANCP
jgi:hypothetical protein